MWYRYAIQYNAFGQIIQGNPKTKNIVSEGIGKVAAVD
jgi:hypothetical protein